MMAGGAQARPPSLQEVDFYPTAVSADGAVVVGRDAAGGVRWTAAGGTLPLGALPGGAWSEAFDVSADGSVIVGTSRAPFGGEDRPFRWTAAGGMVGIGVPSGNAYAVSADGAVIVGDAGRHAFRWDAAGGVALLPAPFLASWASDVSGDGSVVVGGRLIPSGLGFGKGPKSQGVENLRWGSGEPMPLWGSGTWGGPDLRTHVSADGRVVVGATAGQAARWTADRGVHGLGVMPGHEGSEARGVSADGSLVVGNSFDVGTCLDWSFCDVVPTPFIWDEINGMRSLRDLLSAAGVDVSGWRNPIAAAVSADGMTIVGYSDELGPPQGWVVTIPEPAALPLLVVACLFFTRPARWGARS